MVKWLENIESAIGGGPSGPKRIKTLRILLIVGGIGAALMLLNSFLPYRDVEPPASDLNVPPPETAEAWSRNTGPGSSFETFEQQMETRLKDILEKIVGVGTVDVMVNIDSTEEIVVEKNTQESQQTTNENDQGGGRRHISSVTKDGQVVIYEVSGDQKPLVTKVIKPRIRGILIVAEGAENAAVRKLITQAVEKGVSVPVNRLSVVPRKR